MSDPSDAREPADEAVDECSLDGLLGEYYRSSSVLELLGDGTGGLPRVFLQEPDGQVAPIVRPLPAEDLSERSTLVRYQMIGEIARGGMGVVLHARDLDLGRDVAMKVLRKRHADRPEMLARFIEEAQIGGQLQHPGIVPIHELGVRADRRPYFTMKLVKGKTLAVLLAETRELAADRPRFIGIMEKVCQAMAYAHARGVIHRDLKPSNIMVGAFGEVQLLDWGLAKVLRQGGTADERKQERARDPDPLIETVRSGSGSHSSAGSVMGTPAYMPPEQARGEVDKLDERSDVFTLGAILCEVLTGVPPYEGEGRRAREQAAQARLDGAFARLKSCDADPELIELTKSCLSSAPTDRPRSAEELTERLTDYLQSVEKRARDAQIEAAAARRGRKLTLGFAVSVLITVVVGGGSWITIEKQRADRRRETVDQITTVLSEANLLRGQRRWAEALAASELAQDLAQSGEADADFLSGVATQIGELRNEALAALGAEELARENDELLLALQTDVLLESGKFRRRGGSFYLKWAEWVLEEYVEVLQEHGIDLEDQGVDPIVDRLAGEHATKFAAVFGECAVAGRRLDDRRSDRVAKLIAIARRLDPEDQLRHQLWDLLDSEEVDPSSLSRLARDLDPARESASTLHLTGLLLANLNRGEEARRLLERAHEFHPGDFRLNFLLGFWAKLEDPPRLTDALAYFAAARAQAPDSSIVADQMAEAWYKLGNFERALACARQAVRNNPTSAGLRTNLAVVLAKLDPLEALKAYEDALELRPEHPGFMLDVGSALECVSRLDDAINMFDRAIALDGDHFRAHCALGLALEKKGDLEQAIASYQRVTVLDPAHVHIYPILIHALLKTDRDDEVAQVVEGFWRSGASADDLNAMAWSLVDPSGDPLVHAPKLALPLAERAVDRSGREDARILDTLAIARFSVGDIRGAIDVQVEILELMDGKDGPNYTSEEAHEALERYETRLMEQRDADGSR